MHTFVTKKGILFHHHGDYSGEVQIQNERLVVVVSFSDLLEFVGQYVRERRITEIEDANPEDLIL